MAGNGTTSYLARVVLKIAVARATLTKKFEKQNASSVPMIILNALGVSRAVNISSQITVPVSQSSLGRPPLEDHGP